MGLILIIVLLFIIRIPILEDINNPKETETAKPLQDRRLVYLANDKEIPVRFMDYYLHQLCLENEETINTGMIRQAYLIEKEKLTIYTKQGIVVDQSLSDLRAARIYMTDLCSYFAYRN